MRSILRKNIFLFTIPIGVYSAINQKKLQDMNGKILDQLQELKTQNKELNNKLTDLLSQEQVGDGTENEINSVKNELSEIRKSLEEATQLENEIVENLPNMDQSQIEASTSNFVNTLGKFNDKLESLYDYIVKSSGNSGSSKSFTIDNLNIFDSVTNLYYNLNLVETLSLLHISGFIVITLSMLSILNIFYGDKIINYFSLEEKYPKLVKIIQLRRKFQQYYLLTEFSLIFVVIITLTTLDIYMLI